MALRTRYVGSGLGLKPISIGDDPYRADSEFDSTVRIPTTQKRVSIPSPAAGIAAPIPTVQPAPIAPQPPAQPPVQQPTMPPATPTSPPTISQPPGALDPTQLNYEGSTFQPTVSATTSSYNADEARIQDLFADLEEFAGVKWRKDWRDLLRENPDDFLRRVRETADSLTKNADTKHRQRIEDWYKNIEIAAKRQSTAPNSEYAIQYKQQEVFNQALERLKLAGAAGAREQDEELMAMLASRGLLDSGIAAREITRLQEQRNRNLYEAANTLNQMILSGDINRLTARDLATLEADLQKRNQEALLRLQQKFAEANQPNGLAQIIGTAAGTALPFLLSPKAPGKEGRLYGEEDPGFRNA